MKPFELTSLASSVAHSVVCISLLALFPATSQAAPDAAQVAGELMVDGIHFSSDNSVQTKASPWGYGAPNGTDIGYLQGNIGIGTLTPTAKLDVVGTVNATSFTSSGNITTTGSVGIGTASPSVRLDVVGDTNISGALTAGTYKGLNVVGDPTISGVLRLLNPANCWTDFLAPRMESAANGSLFFSIPGVINGNCIGYSYYPMLPVMTLANIGNYPAVGIGTTTPTHMLDVAGPGNFAGAVSAASLSSVGYVGIGTTQPKRQLHIVSQSPTAEISLELAGGTPNNKIWNISAEVSPLPNLDFRVLNDAGTAATTQALTLKNNGNAVFYGNVAASGTVSGTSTSSLGIYGLSTNSAGIKGESTNNTGIWGVGAGVGVDAYSTNNGYGVKGTTGNSIAVYGVNNSTDAPSVEGWNQGSGYIFRGWSGASPALKFYVANNGNAWLAGTLAQASDIRLKTNIQPLENTLDKVLRLRGVSYLMKNDTSQTRRIGVIAQELEQEYPELVATDDQGMKSVAYANLTPVLIEAVKTLKAENDALKSDNAVLRSGYESLKERLDRMEQSVAAIKK